MIKNKRIIAAALALAGVVASGVVAQAAPAGSGWDDTPDVAVGGGSDTTYLVMQRLEVLFNGAPGCPIDNSSSSPNKGKCIVPSTGDEKGNYDHDLFVSATPTGSSAGVRALTAAGPQYNPPITYARSSRGPSGTEANELTFWGFASDGIIVNTFGTRTGVNLTKQDLQDIYGCVKTDWSQFGQPAGPIIPWNMNPSSGTTASFLAYIAPTVPGTCVRSLTSGVAPFENDVKPILADSGPDGTPNTADDNENNFIWWMSFGNYQSYPFTTGAVPPGQTARVNANPVSVEGIAINNSTISNQSYPISRSIYHVTRNTEADCRQAPGTAGNCDNAVGEVYGATGGAGGAVREMTEWMCSNGAALHTVNSVTGIPYNQLIQSAKFAEGFQNIPVALRTPGYSCEVKG